MSLRAEHGDSTSVPVATLAAASHVNSHRYPAPEAFIPSSPTDTVTIRPLSSAVRTLSIADLVSSVCQRLIGSGRCWRHLGPISLVA